jgi:hypothetical protein
VEHGRATPPTASESDADGGEAGETRTVFYPELRNARDLGGVPLATGGQVAYGALFRGPPLTLAADDCSEFSDRDIRTVIDLRVDSEYLVVPEAQCVADQARIVHAPLPIPRGVSPAEYLTDLYTTDSIAAALAVLSDPVAYPVYMHCTYGRDRTGILATVVLLALGASPDAIMREYLLSLPIVGAYPDSLSAVLDELAAMGGIEHYLSRAGLTPEQVATMRSRLIAAP